MMPRAAVRMPCFADALAVCLLLLAGCGPSATPGSATVQVERPARIYPPWTDVTIPPNICPLNVLVLEPGTRFSAAIRGAREGDVRSESADGTMVFPVQDWRSLLRQNRGGELELTIAVLDAADTWTTFRPVRITVADAEIDPFIVYRFIYPIYNLWGDVGVFQRQLTSFDETTVLHGNRFQDGCTNCHAFTARRPDPMSIASRSQTYGSRSLLVRDDRVQPLDTKWGYTAWHPEGTYAAYSLNRVHQFFHSTGEEVRDVLDLDSEIVVWDAERGEVFSAPAIADPERMETYPAWSPDGRMLYFCSAPIPWDDRRKMVPPAYDEVRYDLRRAPFDPARREFGPPETVLAADAVGHSVLLPRVSPDGRYLMCCFCQYGCFPIYQPSSDLVVLDLEAGTHRRLDINSDRSESYHSWSSNGRWFAFSSKRDDGVFTRVYLAHFDRRGRAHKPFLLPQKDPGFYRSCLKAQSVPEFLVEPVRVRHAELARAARRRDSVPVTLPRTTMTPGPDAASRGEESRTPWLPGDVVRER